MDPAPPTYSAIFTADELARLTAYRAAVAAGFFTDACTHRPTPGTALAATVEAVDAAARPACLFTPSEWARLGSYRAAVQAGFYTDGLRGADDTGAAQCSADLCAPPNKSAQM